MKVEYWPIDKPIPYPNNARRITQAAIDKVASSLKEFGFRQPIVVDPDGVIVAGHTRHLAARKLGLTKVPVHIATDLTLTQIRAYRLMDNKSHETLWDTDKLGDELLDLKELDFSLNLTGFEDFEFETLLPDNNLPPRLYQTEIVSLADLKPHPRNYRQHPDDQLAHIINSINQHGFYRNVVVAKDNTILAGHGLVAASRKMGKRRIQVARLDIDPSSIEALKVLVGDNDIADRGEVNDRTLTEILKEIKDKEELLGSGYDEMMLANLLFVTRPASEIKDKDSAAEWAGADMPEFDAGSAPLKLTISFRTESDRAEFTAQSRLEIDKKESRSWTTWWPPREREDLNSIRLEPTVK